MSRSETRPSLRRCSPSGLLASNLEPVRLVEGQTLRVLGLDAYPLLARPVRDLQLGDPIEQQCPDSLATPERIEVENEDLARVRLGHAAASSAHNVPSSIATSQPSQPCGARTSALILSGV